MSKYTISFAQNREDIIIDAFFKGKSSGFYVDIGANHPTIDSVTKFFYLKGWSGINIEPNPYLASLLDADRPKDLNLAIGVGDNTGTAMLRIYENGDGLSTYSDGIKNEAGTIYDAFKKSYHDVETKIDTLKNIFDESVKLRKIDFMKVDVEGLEYEVLMGNDWKKYRPELICIESNHMKADWHKLLDKAGYNMFFNDGLNDYYAEEKSQLVKEFSFPESVFMKYPKIMPFVSRSETSPKAITDDVQHSGYTPSLKQEILGALTVLSYSSRALITRKITIFKRHQLDKKIKLKIKNGDSVRINSVRYTTPKIVLATVLLFGLNVLFKIGHLIQSRKGI